MRTSFVRQLYFTIVTLIALTMMVSSLGWMLYTLLDSAVFVRTETERSIGTPPVYFPAKADPETDNLTCVDSCPFDADEKQIFETWKIDYQSWKEQAARTYDANSLVNALSFFIVSTPLFFIHYRILKREYLTDQDNDHSSAVYALYYYVAALGTLIFAVVFTAMLLNTTLRTWIVTDANDSKNYESTRPDPVGLVMETQYIDAVIACDDACDFSQEDVLLAQEWKADYEKQYNAFAITTWKEDFSRSIAVILVTLPVFWYHWTLVRKKSKKDSQ